MKKSKFIKSSLIAVCTIALVSVFLVSSTTVEQSNSKALDQLVAELDDMKQEITNLKSNEKENAFSNDPFLGEVTLFAGNFAPRGWSFCHGQLLPISQNTALFSILGTTYGGDGRTTFALPDLRGRSAIAPGTGPGLSTIRLGQRSGIENVTLTINNLPSHNHRVATQLPGFELDPKTTSGDEFTKGSNSFITVGNQSNSQISNSKGEASNTGNQQSFNVRDPYLAVNYIIATVGTFPSRS